MKEKRWISENIIPEVHVAYEAERVLELKATAHQQAAVLENHRFGRVLMLDGAVQLTTADEFAYHEMMSHVPLLTHGRATDVLIIGGGDCGLAEEVLKHPEVRRLVQVEIDAGVVQLARQYFSEINAPVFRDERFHLVIGDAVSFVANAEQRFDVVLVDSTDPIGPGQALFTESFYRDVRACLKPEGVVITQSGVPFLQREEYLSSMRNLSNVFLTVSSYLVASPSYFGGHLALGWASRDLDPSGVTLATLAERTAKIRLSTRYYSPEVHKAAFALPRYIGELLEQAVHSEQRALG